MPKPLLDLNISLETILVPLLAAFWLLLITGAIYGRPTFSAEDKEENNDEKKETKKEK